MCEPYRDEVAHNLVPNFQQALGLHHNCPLQVYILALETAWAALITRAVCSTKTLSTNFSRGFVSKNLSLKDRP